MSRIALNALIAANGLLLAHNFALHCYSIEPTSGPSMMPTISASWDWILISKFHSQGRGIQAGDLISFVHPKGEYQVIKRVIADEGDIVQFRRIKESRDGLLVAVNQDAKLAEVPKGHIWVEGDNPDWSKDSRLYGPIAKGLVQGKVIARVWPRPTWFSNRVRVDGEAGFREID
jgi:inner membrane protease subunit 1